MYPDRLVFGLLNTAARFRDRQLFERLRSLTLSWSRYGYSGRIIEADSVDGILRQAADGGFRWSFIQSCGHMIGETWYPQHWDRIPLETAVAHFIEQNEFLVAGPVVGDETNGFGLDEQCLLVDLYRFQECGRPDFGEPCATRVQCKLPKPAEAIGPTGEPVRMLVPSDEIGWTVPRHRGWNLIDTAMRHGLVVPEFPAVIDRHRLFVSAPADEASSGVHDYLGGGISDLREDDIGLGDTSLRLLKSVQSQVKNARRGVFLWNLEAYDDVAIPPAGFASPVSTLYSVASGLKPNVMLRNLGMDEQTRVVFFDYSPKALEIRKLMVDEWDGQDYPQFVRYILRKNPHPETFYQLWADQTPDALGGDDLERMWEVEIRKWGGESSIREHWDRYRQLEHEYVLCNLLDDRAGLLDRIRPEPSAAIWWSNAFFTIFCNWLYTIDHRREIYSSWIAELSQRNPDLLLYGSDFNNISVNHVRAAEYLRRLTHEEHDCLRPLKVNQCEIRF